MTAADQLRTFGYEEMSTFPQISKAMTTTLKWLSRLGYMLIATGALLLSPLSDLLPVDLWGTLASQSSGSHQYMRVVSVESSWVLEAALIATGILLVLVVAVFRAKRG